MIPMKRSLLYIVLFLNFWSCQPHSETVIKNKQTDHSSAIPDGETLETIELSDTDKKKISDGKGIEIQQIELSQIEYFLTENEKKTSLCYLWSLEDRNNEKAFASLKELSNKFSNPSLQLLVINVDAKEQHLEVNSFIRRSGLDAAFYQYHFLSKLNPTLLGIRNEGDVPAYFIYNAIDETGLWFNQPMDVNELYVMIQSFII